MNFTIYSGGFPVNYPKVKAHLLEVNLDIYGVQNTVAI